MAASAKEYSSSKVRKYLPFVSLLAVAIASITAVIVAHQLTQPDTGKQLAESPLNRNRLAYLVSNKHYRLPDYQEVYRHTHSIQELDHYLHTLDPYSKYLSSAEVAFIKERSNKSRTGIGLDLLMNRGKILGVPILQGPAYQAGMILPAYINSIDGHKISYSDFSSYAFLTKYHPGKIVPVKLESRTKSGKSDYAIKTAKYINQPILHFTYNDIFTIYIKKFSAGLNGQLNELLEMSKGYKKLVFDLRHCPGGDLYAMVDMVSQILPGSLNVVTIQKANGSDELTLRTLPNKVIGHPQLILLTSEFTASSAELFTWAIKIHEPTALIVGQPTKGKCMAQDTLPLADGSAILLTTFEVLNAANQSCQGIPMVLDLPIHDIALLSYTDIFHSLSVK